LYPALRFVVQLGELGSSDQQSRLSTPSTPQQLNWPIKPMKDMSRSFTSRITVQQRTVGGPQPVRDAAVYILRVPTVSPSLPSHALLARISAELKAHLGILRSNSSATLVLAANLLPEPGAVDPDIEAVSRLRDLALSQLANQREIGTAEVMEVVNAVRDETGQLVLVNKLHSRSSATVALEIRYRADADRNEYAPTPENGCLPPGILQIRT
jgi:hypothetical protein